MAVELNAKLKLKILRHQFLSLLIDIQTSCCNEYSLFDVGFLLTINDQTS